MTIIFTTSVRGHYMEYLHHIHEVCANNKEETYVFLVPSEFKEYSKNIGWEESENIIFDFVDDVTSELFQTLGMYKKSLLASKLLRRKVKEYSADRIFATSLMYLLPFCAFLIPRKVKLSGIIYMIYLYRLKELSLYGRLTNIVKYVLMSYWNVFDKILILNDEASANELNRIYKVNKYQCIIDPFSPFADTNRSNDLRKEYNISEDKILFSQFGALNMNKGSVEIVESIKLMPPELAKKCVFLFAGRVNVDIKEKFYKLVEEARQITDIIVHEGYCSYDFFADICRASNAFVLPYKRTSQSSGVIGYASQYGKPAIAPNKGLLGQLVKKYNLGILMPDNSPESLVDAYKAVIDGKYDAPSKEYSETHTIRDFQNVINQVIS